MNGRLDKTTPAAERDAKRLAMNLGPGLSKAASKVRFASSNVVFPAGGKGASPAPAVLTAMNDARAVRLKARELGLIDAQQLADEAGWSLHALLTSHIPQGRCPRPDHVLFGARYWKPETLTDFRRRMGIKR